MTTTTTTTAVASRKPQYVQINQWPEVVHDYCADEAWMAARIDDDVIFEPLYGYFFFADYKRLDREKHYRFYLKTDLFANNTARVSEAADPLDWWSAVLTHESWRNLEVQFTIRFDSAYGKHLIPRDASLPPKVDEEKKWKIHFLVDCQPPLLHMRYIEICFIHHYDHLHFYTLSGGDRHAEHRRARVFYNRMLIVRYSMLVLFDSATFTNSVGATPSRLLRGAITELDTPECKHYVTETKNRVFVDHREVTTLKRVANKNTLRTVVIYTGTRKKLLTVEKWFLSNTSPENVTRVWMRADGCLGSSPSDRHLMFTICWFPCSVLRTPAKHAYLVERAMVLMHMLLAPCMLGQAQQKSVSRVRVVLPVYVLMWIFEWLPDECLDWDEVSRLRCLSGVQQSLRRVLQARPNLTDAAVGKRTRRAKQQDWV
jgi:hypothetical protein